MFYLLKLMEIVFKIVDSTYQRTYKLTRLIGCQAPSYISVAILVSLFPAEGCGPGGRSGDIQV